MLNLNKSKKIISIFVLISTSMFASTKRMQHLEKTKSNYITTSDPSKAQDLMATLPACWDDSDFSATEIQLQNEEYVKLQKTLKKRERFMKQFLERNK